MPCRTGQTQKNDGFSAIKTCCGGNLPHFKIAKNQFVWYDISVKVCNKVVYFYYKERFDEQIQIFSFQYGAVFHQQFQQQVPCISAYADLHRCAVSCGKQ